MSKKTQEQWHETVDALLVKVESIERENAQLKAAIEQQKETIATLTRLDRVDSNFDVITEQSALIEKLANCLKDDCYAFRYHDQSRKEALAAYTKWKESK
jgi:predicted RNase H-like nuclease (RuvC/YqgF family)